MRSVVIGLLSVGLVTSALAQPKTPDVAQLQKDIAQLQRYIQTLRTSRDASDTETVITLGKLNQCNDESKLLREQIKALETQLKAATAPKPEVKP